METAVLTRGGHLARGNLPPGVLFRRKARTKGNAKKEFFLVVCGDPKVSAPWLAWQIHNLEARNFDVQRSRAGAQFDTNERPVLVFDKNSHSYQENACQPPRRFPKQAASRSRSRKVHQTGRQRLSRASKSPVSSPAHDGENRVHDKVNGTILSAPASSELVSEEHGQLDIENEENKSSWQLFYRSAQHALLESRACLGWASNPPDLVDTLASAEDWLNLLDPDLPSPEAAAPWKESEELLEVVFCITSFLREDQLKKSLPLNLLWLAPFRKHVQIVLVTFGPDAKLQKWVRFHLRWALEQGFLRLASGGQAPGTAEPAQTGRWIERQGQAFRSWHAAVAKNTSHVAAFQVASQDLEKTLFVNLDNDNLLGFSYLKAVAESALECKRSWHGGACPGVACGSGSLTGRLAYWALDFAALGGYDQEEGGWPSGDR